MRGPNGSGKTTLLRTLAGLQSPITGKIGWTPEDIAYSSHADGIKLTLTVQENLAFWAGIYGQDGVDDALEAFDLTDLRKRMAQQLSAGQKRRLGLARLRVTGRKIWLCDEPTVSLDAASTAFFAAAVASHCGAGGVAVLATHIDLGIKADTLDMMAFQPKVVTDAAGFDGAFL